MFATKCCFNKKNSFEQYCGNNKEKKGLKAHKNAVVQITLLQFWLRLKKAHFVEMVRFE